MNPRFQTAYFPMVFEGEYNDMPSETVPSKSLSLREIIDRDLSGMLSPSADVQPYYNDEIIIPDFKKMDLVDIDNWKAAMDLQRLDIIETIKSEKKARKEAEERDRAEAQRRQEAAQAQSQSAVKSDESAK